MNRRKVLATVAGVAGGISAARMAGVEVPTTEFINGEPITVEDAMRVEYAGVNRHRADEAGAYSDDWDADFTFTVTNNHPSRKLRVHIVVTPHLADGRSMSTHEIDETIWPERTKDVVVAVGGTGDKPRYIEDATIEAYACPRAWLGECKEVDVE